MRPSKYRENLVNRGLNVFVDHDVLSQFPTDFQLIGRTRQAFGDVFGVIASSFESSLKGLDRRRLEQYDDRSGLIVENLSRPLDLNFQENVLACCGRRMRRSVEISVKFSPLEKDPVANCLFEVFAIDKDVLIAIFTRSPLSRRPAARQPQCGVAFNESARNRSLTNATGTDQNNGAQISGQGPETTRLAALVRVRECDGSRQSRRCA